MASVIVVFVVVLAVPEVPAVLALVAPWFSLEALDRQAGGAGLDRRCGGTDSARVISGESRDG